MEQINSTNYISQLLHNKMVALFDPTPAPFSGFRYSHNPTKNENLNKQLYECTICKETIYSIEKLLSHCENHIEMDKELPHELFKLKNFFKECIECGVCKAKFSRTRYLQSHLYAHMNYRPYSCNNCDKKFTNKNSLKRHNNIYTQHQDIPKQKSGKQFTSCSICNKVLSTERSLRQHLLTHQEKSYECKICKKVFASKDNLKSHVLNHGASNKNVNSSPKIKHKSNNKDQIEMCKEYSKSCKNDVNCLQPDIYDNKFWKCEFCGKGFTLVTKLANHEAAHGKTFSCNVCNKQFMDMNSLCDHKQEHDGQTPWHCKICNKFLATKYNLARHNNIMHLKHNNENIFALCSICDEEFKTEIHLKEHMLQHTEE